jgi:PAS domain S-box-containing protein
LPDRTSDDDHPSRHPRHASLDEDDALAQAIIDMALDAFVEVDADARISGWSTQAEGLFGWSRAEAIGMPAPLTIAARHRRAVARRVFRLLLSGETPVVNRRLKTTTINRDGREFVVEIAVLADPTPAAVGARLLRARPHRAQTHRRGWRRRDRIETSSTIGTATSRWDSMVSIRW